MPYIGRQPVTGSYSKLDDISSGFNGSQVNFTLAIAGTNYVPGVAEQLLISIDGVLQEPGVAFTVASSTITFSTAPASGASFFGVALGDAVNIGTPSNSTVTAAKLTNNAVVESKIADGAVTRNKLDANTAYYDEINTYTAAQRGSIVDLGVRTGPASTNTVTIDLSSGNYFKMTSNANILFANPSNVAEGQGGSIFVTSNGSFTVSWGSQWRFPTGTIPTFSTTAGKVDRVDYVVQTSNTIHTSVTVDLLGTS